MEHSPEPWSNRNPDLIDRNRDCIAFCHYPADLDRIIACVNALAGIPTEDIERVVRLGRDMQALRPMSEAPRDRTRILAKVKDDDERFPGRIFEVRHEGVIEPDGFDLGWSLFPGYGGVPEHQFEGWLPCPALGSSPD